jgi:hypothetical protein
MEAMRTVPFQFGGKTVHWMDLYMGFGFAISVSGFVFAALAWLLSNVRNEEAPLARNITWMLCAVQVGSIAISLRYFGPVQAGFSVASAALLAWSAVRLAAAGEANVRAADVRAADVR